jgi:hypothetical protein
MNEQKRPFTNLGGYFVDVLRLASGMPINLHSYMKYLSIKVLARRSGAHCFIETGTYFGVTAARCARLFKRVFTIELDSELATKAASHLKRFVNVEVFQGDAVMWLPQLIVREDVQDLVVFLDAHFSGGKTALGDVPEPALLELEILGRHLDKICGIIVDDFRLFGVESGFPAKSELISVAERLFPYPRFDLKIHADQLLIQRR